MKPIVCYLIRLVSTLWHLSSLRAGRGTMRSMVEGS